MGKSAAWLTLSFILLTAAATLSCNNSVDDMLGEYNGGFQTGYVSISGEQSTEADAILQPGDSGFDETTMLRDEYFMGWDSTLNLYAPENCTYQWYITNPDDKKDTKIEFVPCNAPYNSQGYVTEVTTRIFSLYAEECALENGTTYKLTLNVWKGGRKYTDICSLVVYQHYLLSQ